MNTPDNLGPDMSATGEFILPGRGTPPAPHPEEVSSNGAGARPRMVRRPPEPGVEEQPAPAPPPITPRQPVADRPLEPAAASAGYPPARSEPYEATRPEATVPETERAPARTGRRHAANREQTPDELLSQVPTPLAEHPLLTGLLAELPPRGSAPPPAYLDQWLEATRAVLELLYARDALDH